MISISEPGLSRRLGGGAFASNMGAGAADTAGARGAAVWATDLVGAAEGAAAGGAALPSAALKNARWAAMASGLRVRVGAIGAVGGAMGVIGGMGWDYG